MTGVIDLYQQGKEEIAALVLLTIVLAPVAQIALLLYVLVPLRWNRVPWQLPHAFRLLRHAQPWSMIEVFMIGILVAITKLMGMATIVPGLALWSFVLLMLVLAGRDRRPSTRSPSGNGWRRCGERGTPAPRSPRPARAATTAGCSRACRSRTRARRALPALRRGAARAQAAQPRAHLGARDRRRSSATCRPTCCR